MHIHRPLRRRCRSYLSKVDHRFDEVNKLKITVPQNVNSHAPATKFSAWPCMSSLHDTLRLYPFLWLGT